MDIVVHRERLKEKVSFEIGDIIVWNGNPYLAIQRPKFCLISLDGKGLACGGFDSYEELEHRVNETCKLDTMADIKVYSKEDYVLSLERRK